MPKIDIHVEEKNDEQNFQISSEMRSTHVIFKQVDCDFECVSQTCNFEHLRNFENRVIQFFSNFDLGKC